MGDIVNILISLIVGGVGGNVAGAVLKNFSLGTIGYTIAGVVGGGVGGSILSTLTGMDTSAVAAGGGLDIGGLLGATGGAAIGGGGLLAIVGVVRNMMKGGD